jgi:hypothetical protein
MFDDLRFEEMEGGGYYVIWQGTYSGWIYRNPITKTWFVQMSMKHAPPSVCITANALAAYMTHQDLVSEVEHTVSDALDALSRTGKCSIIESLMLLHDRAVEKEGRFTDFDDAQKKMLDVLEDFWVSTYQLMGEPIRNAALEVAEVALRIAEWAEADMNMRLIQDY